MGKFLACMILAGLLAGSTGWSAEQKESAKPAVLPDAAMAVVARHKSLFDGPPRGTPANAAIDAPLLGNGDMLVALAGAGGAPEFLLSKNDFWLLKHGGGGPRPFGRLALRFPDLEGADWKAEQDLATAVTTLRLEKDGKAVTARSWVAATENLLVVELAAEGSPIAGKFELIPAGAAAQGPPRRVNLGREQHGGGRWYLDGLLDEVQVFNRALSAAEVQTLKVGERLPDGLLRHWAFDEPEGDVAKDSSAQGGDGTIRGAERVAGLRGRALKLDGRGGFIECPPMAVPGTFTLSARVWLNRHAAAGPAQYIFSMGEWNQGCSLGISQDQLRLAVGNVFVQSSKPVPLGRWVHLAGTCDGQQMRLYLDGEELDRKSDGPAGGEAFVETTPQGLRAVRRFAGGVDIPTAAACAVRLLNTDGTSFTLEPGKPLVLAAAMESQFKTPEYLEAVTKRIARLSLDEIGTLRARHQDWWRDFWSRSFVELDDPVIEQRYYLSNYVMASCSRDPQFPPNIFGWVTTDGPAWAGDYHLNYNHMAPFYGLYSSNHLEQAVPYHAPLLDFMDRGRFYAKSILGIRGVYFPVGIGPKGIETTRHIGNTKRNAHVEDEGLFFGQKSNAAYALVNTAMHWYATYDPRCGRELYPLVREVADFWEDYLKFEEGRYVIYADSIHEGSGENLNPILTLGLLRNTFALALDMSRELNVDQPRRERWQHILDHLSGYSTQERGGKNVFRYTEKGTDWCGSNTLGIQHIYPAGAIGLDSDPKLLELSHNTIAVLGRWRDMNGMNSFYPAAVRVGYDPQVILTQLRAMIEAIGQPNGFIRGNPHGIENCSIVPSTINEMLLLSHEGVLRLFHVWPRERNARFANLRARGAFLVSSALTDGKVQYVTLLSERGRDAIVETPWPGMAVAVTRNGQKAETLTGERLSLKTSVGETVGLAPVKP